ncbi:hypothetical protein IYR97_26195 (plasmid) [Pseudomonas fulva]|jgi:hypothetical protein|uniref:Uncharacterized protein n=3 Tax=Pseudomonas TaxID=286 RepID=A0AAJ5V4J1_9PSED|nr:MULTISPECIES: hypothetical protein [Pseudomonas]MCT8162877.1 hypothetical protein [Pseudomonas sp. HD6422]MCT8181354.1 hypothetical protein [Pseudomonas sp. HD6421]MDH1929054.1 hypothetical protein [Pseudomonas sp. GD03696]MDM1711648.1 hypothetical protein [Pseudomonas sp. 165]ORL52188.1 hypothetical protein B7H18_09240 [Pseudomonas putida]
MNSVEYEALDELGSTYLRPARIISELPWAQRRTALTKALPVIGKLVSLVPQQQFSFGLGVFKAFRLNAAEARRHPQVGVLTLSAGDISLDLVPGYGSPELEGPAT